MNPSESPQHLNVSPSQPNAISDAAAELLSVKLALSSQLTPCSFAKSLLLLLCWVFRYDDLSNYVNERSLWLAKLRDMIEEPWQEWELGQLLSSPDVVEGEAQGKLEGYRALSSQDLKDALKTR